MSPEVPKRVVGLTVMLTLGGPALAEPYWVSYEGDALPEEVGWTRIHEPPGADRRVEDGVFVLDSSSSIHLADFYEYHVAELDPEPGEWFVLRWHLQVDQLEGLTDPVVAVASDDLWQVGFEFSDGFLRSALEPDVLLAIDMTTFHEFELRSEDMRHYVLLIDGTPALSGEFFFGTQRSRVAWGDGITGSASISRWNYLQFGVVPEPVGVLSLLTLSLIQGLQRRR